MVNASLSRFARHRAAIPARRPAGPSRRPTRAPRRRLRAFGSAALAFALLLGPGLASATGTGGAGTAFNLDNFLPPSLRNQPFIVQIITLLIAVGIAGLFVMLAFGGMSGIADLFSSLGESRQRGEWGSFVETVGFVTGVFVVSAVVGGTLIGWFTNLTINPTINILGGGGGGGA